jgi:hypothetical protein
MTLKQQFLLQPLSKQALFGGRLLIGATLWLRSFAFAHAAWIYFQIKWVIHAAERILDSCCNLSQALCFWGMNH